MRFIQRSIRDKRQPARSVFLTSDDVKVERRHCYLSMIRRKKTLLVEEGSRIERGTVFLRDTCHHEIN